MKKILMLIIFSILLVPTVLALEWDNTKSYNLETKTITFSNTFLHLFKIDEIAKTKLDTPQINKVFAGRGIKTQVAQISIEAFGDYDNALKEIELIDLNTEKTITRQVEYRYLDYYEIDVPNYKKVCEESKTINISTGKTNLICLDVEDGTEKLGQQRWLPFDKNIKLGNTTIGIYTNVYAGDNIEWYPNMFGLKVTEWARWTAVNAHANYTFDNTANYTEDTGTTKMHISVTAGKFTAGTNCKVGNCGKTNQTMKATLNQTATLRGSFGFWERSTDLVTRQFMLNYNAGNWYQISLGDTGYAGKLRFVGNIDIASGYLANNTWIHAVVKMNNTGGSIWINGSMVASANSASLTFFGSGTANGIFSYYDGTGGIVGNTEFDECRFYDQAEVGELTAAQIADWYTTESVYTDIISPTVTIVIPSSDNKNYTSLDGVNYTTTDDVGIDSCWWSNNSGITNHSLINCVNVTSTWEEGQNNITVYANDSANNVGSAIRKFNIDTIYPTVNITYPENKTYGLVNALNFIASDNLGLFNCWFDNSTTNQTTSCNANITGNNSIDGTNIWRIWVNDSVGHINSSTVTFTSDAIYPLINMTYPTLDTGVSKAQSNIYINTTWTETNFENITFKISGDSAFYNVTTYSHNFTSLADGLYFYNATICDTTNNCNTTITRNITLDNLAPIMNVIYPTNTTYNYTITDFNYTITHPTGTMDTCWYSLNLGITNTSFTNCNTNVTGLTGAEGTNVWYLYGNDTANNLGNASITFFQDAVYPLISYGTGTEADYANVSQSNIYINTTWIETNFKNITFRINGVSVNYSVATYNHNFTGLSDGIYTYNVTICDIVNNCNTTTSRNITLDNVAPSITIAQPTSSLLSRKNQSLNYTVTDTLTKINTCWWTKDSGVSNTTLPSCANTTIILPLGNTSITIYANDSAGNIGNSTVHPYYLPIISLCNVTSNLSYLNFTFKNETTAAESVTSTFVSTFYYWYDDEILINRTLSYSSAVENKSYAFCLVDGSNESIKIKPLVTYDNSESVPRTYNPNAFTINNITTNVTLYLLPTSEGIYVTFQVINSAGQVLSGVLLELIKNGLPYESGATDDTGSKTFFMNPYSSYTLLASKSGYTNYSTTITPTQTAYTITLTSTISTTDYNYNTGISYYIQPLGIELTNDTIYSFNFTINSSYWALEKYGFNLVNGNGISYGSTSDTTQEGGVINLNVNTRKNKTIIMNFYWVVNGTYSNGTRLWQIVNTADSGWSIWHFFTRLKTYTNDSTDSDGLFGLKTEEGKNFSMAIIIFLIIFTFAGIMSIKFGLSSSGAIMLLIFTLTLFFDVGLGLVPNPINAVPHFATFLTALILIAVFLREVFR